MALTLTLTPGLTWANEPTADPSPTSDAVVVEAEPTETPTEPAAPSESTTPTETETSPEPSPQPTIVEKTIEAVKNALGSLQDESDFGGIMPMAVGEPDGGEAPYLYWSVKDSLGNPVGGASFNLRYWVNNQWSSSTEITDCTSEPCAGPDLDPDPGEFLVKQFGNHTVANNSRYQLQRRNTTPSGYTWITGTGWIDSNTKTWADQTLDFGTFWLQKNDNRKPSCEAGYIYGIGSTGQLQQIAPDGSKTNIGTKASGVSSFNGLGIGPEGKPVFAYERTTGSNNSVSVATIWKYDTDNGQWSNTDTTVNSNNNSRTVQFVAGAVSLERGMIESCGWFLGVEVRGTRLPGDDLW